MISRRRFIQNALVGIGSGLLLPSAVLGAPVRGSIAGIAAKYKFLLNMMATIPEGCGLRIVAQSGQKIGKSGYQWHGAPDGGACFAAPDGGWIYVSNSEQADGAGGVGAIRFNKAGEVVDAYPILTHTNRNCAGGRTPWGTWLSCEENGDFGNVYECDPTGKQAAKMRPALGACNHEAAAVDPELGHVYMTEDMVGGCLYRFTPVEKGDLSEGLLEVGVTNGTRLDWVKVTDPSAQSTVLRSQVPNAARFDGGEGIVYGNRHVYFTTKKDDKVWSLHLDTHELKIVYDASRTDHPILTGVDNIEIASNGELIVAEDGGDMQLVVLDQAYRPVPLVTLHAQAFSEITGPAFSPDESRLYFSSQRGVFGNDSGGTTYELSLPLHLISKANLTPYSVG